MSKLLPILLFLLLFCGTASAETIFVNETGWYRSGDAFNATATPIQHAVDNATAGDTVYVWNGTYVENVVISTAITLEGEDNSTTIVRSPSSGSNGITISSDNVILKEICITHCMSCIYLNLIDNCTIQNIITPGDYPNNRSSYDVRMYSSTNIVIEYNQFASVRPVYTSSSNNITFRNNTLSPSIQSYTTAEMLNLNDSVIEHNTFHQGYEGALKITGANNVSVTSNAFPSGRLYLTNYNNSNVMYNTMTHSKGGLHLTSSENVDISHNVHTMTTNFNDGSSIGIYSSNTITVHNNSINLTGDMYWEAAAFRISNSVNVTATNTTITTVSDMIGKFIVISGTTKEQYNHSIDTSNTLFGEPMYYYFNNTSVSLHDLSSNYLKLAYCNNAVLNNTTFTEQWADKNIVQSDAVQITDSALTIRLESSDHTYASYYTGDVYIDPASINTTLTKCNFSTHDIYFDESGTSYVTISYCTIDGGMNIEHCDHCTVSWNTFLGAPNIQYLDDLTFSHNEISTDMVVLDTVTNSAFSNNIFRGVILLENSNNVFTSNTFHSYGSGGFALYMCGISTNTAFTDSAFYGTPASTVSALLPAAHVNLTFTDTTFEHTRDALDIGIGADVKFIQNNRRIFVPMGGWWEYHDGPPGSRWHDWTAQTVSGLNTTIDGSQSVMHFTPSVSVSGGSSVLFSFPHFYCNPSSGSCNVTNTVWNTTSHGRVFNYQDYYSNDTPTRGTKLFNLTATDPAANVAMQLGDFGNSVPIQISIDGVAKEIVHTGSNSILSYTYTDGIGAKTQFKFETYDKTTTNPDAIYEDVNNSINDVGVYEYDNWVTGLTEITNLSVNTTVSTATLRVTDYTANSTGNFTISSGEPSCVVVFNLETVPAGTYTSFYTNGVKTYIAKATSSNISTYYDIGGFATAATLRTVRVEMGLGTETTATMTVGDTGTRDISTYMPLLTSGMPLGYKVSNVSSVVTNSIDAAMINYTVTNSTIVVISEDAGVTPSNLPLVIGGGAAAIVVIIFLRRRRR